MSCNTPAFLANPSFSGGEDVKSSMQRIDETSVRSAPVIYSEEPPYWEALTQRTLKLLQFRPAGER